MTNHLQDSPFDKAGLRIISLQLEELGTTRAFMNSKFK